MDEKLFKLQIISPDRIFYEGECDMLEIKTTEGEMGILKGHIPLTAIVAPGILRIKKDQEDDLEAALLDGFVEIQKDRVTILAEACEWPDEIDINRANEAKIRAERRLSQADGEINVARAELSLRRSLIRIEIAQKKGR